MSNDNIKRSLIKYNTELLGLSNTLDRLLDYLNDNAILGPVADYSSFMRVIRHTLSHVYKIIKFIRKPEHLFVFKYDKRYIQAVDRIFNEIMNDPTLLDFGWSSEVGLLMEMAKTRDLVMSVAFERQIVITKADKKILV